MYKDLKFPILIVHRDIKADTVAGDRVRAIARELEQDGFSILPTANAAEGRIVASTHHGLACILVAAEGAGENQRLLQDRLELAVGRSNARQHFYMANCENVITCNDPVIDNSTGILPYPYGSWGGYTRYRFDSGYYLHSGVFESNPQHYFKRTKGFDWDPGDASGVTWLAGVGAKADFTQDPYAYHYELNGFHNTGEQIDPMDGRLRRGSDGLLFKFRQTLAREGEAAVPERGWQVLGLAVDQAPAVQQFLQRVPVTFPIGMAGLPGVDLSRALGNATGGLPFTVVFSPDGEVAHRQIGKLTAQDLDRLGDLFS